MPAEKTRVEILKAEIAHLSAIRDKLQEFPMIGTMSAKQFNDKHGNFNIWRFEGKMREFYLTSIPKFIENNIEKLEEQIKLLKAELKSWN